MLLRVQTISRESSSTITPPDPAIEPAAASESKSIGISSIDISRSTVNPSGCFCLSLNRSSARRTLAELPPGMIHLFPKEIEDEHAKLADFLYENVNNGVYRAGFATRQRPYEISCRKLFEALDELEMRLSKSRYLFDRRIVEVDWRLFCTLVRFDVVYHGHFKCNVRRIVDYSNLQGYLMDLYQQPGISDTVNFDHIKRHYYMTHTQINPTRIVPIGPAIDLTKPHGRQRI